MAMDRAFPIDAKPSQAVVTQLDTQA